MKKKLIILSIILAILAIASWLAVRLVYSHKVPLNVATVLSHFYNIKAGEVIEDNDTYAVYLVDYLRHYRSLENFKQNFQDADTGEVSDLAWQAAVKELWVKNLAKNFDITVDKDEVEQYLGASLSKEDLDKLEAFAKENYKLSLEDFKDKIVKANLLEVKVYQKLLENYNDKEGITKAQDAYAALEAGEDFLAVAQKYSTMPETAETSIWLKEEELLGFYEPIKEMEIGQFSKIVIVPQAYVIWKLENIVTDENNPKSLEIRSIVIDAKTMDDFFQQYFTITRFNRFY
jgi:hypothetical protein